MFKIDSGIVGFIEDFGLKGVAALRQETKLNKKAEYSIGYEEERQSPCITSVDTISKKNSNKEIHQNIQKYRTKLKTIGITGTNGKSSTTSMLSSIVRASGEPYAEMTTLGSVVEGKNFDHENREMRFLKTIEAAIEDYQVKTLCLEVTSQALMQGFARNWASQVAIFTNLTLDHLDLHKSPEHYLASKAQLFTHLPPTGTAVLNADDPSAHLIKEVIPPYCSITWYSLLDSAVDLSASEVFLSSKGTTITLHASPLANEFEGEIELQAVGNVFAYNALGACLGAYALGYSPAVIKQGLKDWKPIKGRFEIVHHSPLVIIDYAHTPDGLERTLETAQALNQDGLLFCIFGCGGNREQSKRPKMGGIANRLADRIIVTSDNPRHESNEKIVREIMAGIENPERWKIIHDRKEAIEEALGLAEANDIVLIAGKGHETTQSISGEELPFSDHQVVEEFYDPSIFSKSRT